MKNNEKGFTIVELVIVMAITALLLIPIGSLLITNTTSIIHTNEKTDVQEKAMNVMSTFRTHCMYTKKIKSVTANGANYLYENIIPEGVSYEVVVVKPSSSGEKETAYQYDATNKEFKVDGALLSKDIVVDIIPLFTADMAPSERTFDTAVGVMVEVSVSRTNTAIKKTSEVNELTNTFFFRNAGVDFNTAVLEDAEGSPAPTPYPIPTLKPDNDSDTDNDSSGDTGGGSSGSTGDDSGGGTGGDSGGNTGDDSDSGTGGNSGGNSGSDDNSDITSPTEEPSNTPTPTPEPTAEPTPAPVYEGLNIVVSQTDAYNFTWSVYNPSGTLLQTSNQYNYYSIWGDMTFDGMTVERFSDGKIKSLDIYVVDDSSLSSSANVTITISLEDWMVWNSDAIVTIHNQITGKSNVKIDCKNNSSATLLVDDASTRVNGIEKSLSKGESFTSTCN